MLTPEERLIVRIARRAVDRGAVSVAAGEVRDWNRVIDLAARHGLLPLLAAHLDGIAVPQDFARKLAVARIQTRQRNETTIAELLRLVEAAGRHGVRYAVYKGPAVAQRYYRDATLRDYGDFDILVDRESLPVVDEAISELGYSLRVYSDRHAQARNRAKGCEELWSTPSGAMLDLHWTLTDDFFPIRLTTAELLGRSVVEPIPGGEVRTFCAEDDLIVLATHAAKHRFSRLEWTTAVGEAMTRPDLDWNAVVERSTRGECATSVATACTLASRVLGFPLPAAIGGLRVRRSDVEELVAVFSRRLFAPTAVSEDAFASSRVVLRMFDRRLHGIRASLLMIFAPRPADTLALPLPLRLRWLYYVLRPFRLMGKYARRMVG